MCCFPRFDELVALFLPPFVFPFFVFPPPQIELQDFGLPFEVQYGPHFRRTVPLFLPLTLNEHFSLVEISLQLFFSLRPPVKSSAGEQRRQIQPWTFPLSLFPGVCFAVWLYQGPPAGGVYNSLPLPIPRSSVSDWSFPPAVKSPAPPQMSSPPPLVERWCPFCWVAPLPPVIHTLPSCLGFNFRD